MRIRRLAHRGTIEASAYFIEANLIGEDEARRRVIARWSHEASAYAIGGGVLLCLAKPERIHASRAPGVPLVLMKGALVSAPLDPQVAEAQAERTAIFVREGRIVVEPLREEAVIDPARWIDVSGFESVNVDTLGAIPKIGEVLEPIGEVDLGRSLLGKLGDLPPEVELVRRMIRDNIEAPKAPPATIPLSTRLRTLGAALKDALSRLIASLGSFGSGSPGSRGSSSAKSETTTPVIVQRSIAPPQRSRFRAFLARIGEELARMRAIRRIFGEAQAQYIERMMRLFEKNDLTDALRHAIPLGDLKKAKRPPRPALGLPAPRKNLAITSGTAAAATGIGVGRDVFADIRSLYRRAFEKLERQGRYEEAAFVLAELLQETEEAVMFLERHGHLLLSAQLAESRELAPALVVRQWFLAGQIDRAVRIARRHGAFQDAILRLENKAPKKAELLRLLWADTLAEAGDFNAAVDAIWPVPHARHLAVPWINRAIESGGTGAARMMVKALVLLPHSLASLAKKIAELLDDEREEAAPVRAAFASAILAERASPPQLLPVARSTVRSILRDAERRFETLDKEAWSRLVKKADDPLLRMDLSPYPPPPTAVDLVDRQHPRATFVARTDTGTLAIWDAALLPDGRLLVALGEAGARLLLPDGRTAAHFDRPANHLVISDHGDRAIAVARRGPMALISRIDVARRTSSIWCERMLGAFAGTFDGSMWFAAERTRDGRERLLALDATTAKHAALWRLEAEERRIAAVSRSASQLSALLIEEGASAECWTWDLPALALRRRAPAMFEHDTFSSAAPAAAVEPNGLAVLIEAEMGSLTTIGDQDATLRFGTYRRCLFCGTSGPGGLQHLREIPIEARIGDPDLDAQWLLVPLLLPSAVSLRLYSTSNARLSAVIGLAGASRAIARMMGGFIVAADDRGRLIVFERRHGRVVRSLRI